MMMIICIDDHSFIHTDVCSIQWQRFLHQQRNEIDVIVLSRSDHKIQRKNRIRFDVHFQVLRLTLTCCSWVVNRRIWNEGCTGSKLIWHLSFFLFFYTLFEKFWPSVEILWANWNKDQRQNQFYPPATLHLISIFCLFLSHLLFESYQPTFFFTCQIYDVLFFSDRQKKNS